VAKYTTNYVNLIADNLRDRYQSGFPILKELVQNADDAGAGNLVFGHHRGFESGVNHPLLSGPSLWVLNDGNFKPKDKQAISSFGLNGKAADDSAIGKFGLGMKSVFHLCESFFYLAFDGQTEHCEILSPWFGDENTAETHQRWEQISEADRASLIAVAREQAEASNSKTWFMLWVPLRKQSHLAVLDGKKLPGIIDRFPGDRGGEDLDFLSASGVDQRLGLLLPLLRSLHTARFAGVASSPAFRVQLQLEGDGTQRLDHQTDGLKCSGAATDHRSTGEHLRFLVKQRVAVSPEPFRSLRANDSWPKSIAILDTGKWGSVPDKTRPEGAVMIAHADKRIGQLVLQWAVFLPTEELRMTYVASIPNSSREYRIVLHGQFFVDAGRRGIADYEKLHFPRENLPDHATQQMLLQHWNQALAQEVVLPEFLPALAAYALQNGLRDEDLLNLTRAIGHCTPDGEAASTGFLSAFGAHICAKDAWVRSLQIDGPAWILANLANTRILPLPCPPARDHDRPWRALPGLSDLRDVVFVDSEAPAIAPTFSTWDEVALLTALSGVGPETLLRETLLAYLVQFLEMERLRFISTSTVQDALVLMLKRALSHSELSAIRSNRVLFQKLVSLLNSDRRLAIGPQSATAKGSFSQQLYRLLLAANTYALLLPGDLGAPAATSTTAPRESDLSLWLGVIHKQIELQESSESQESTDVESLLGTSDQFIQSIGEAGKQASFMLSHRGLRVLRAIDGREGRVKPVSLNALLNVHQHCMLYRAADVVNKIGYLKELASALPRAAPLVVERSVSAIVQADIDMSTRVVPASSDINGMLAAIALAERPPGLGTVASRKALVKLAIGADLSNAGAVKAIRYLLHASEDNFNSNDPLWLDPAGVSSAWVKLWQMVDVNTWNVLPSELSDQIPSSLWAALGLFSVNANTVIERLRLMTAFPNVEAGQFSSAEISLILGQVNHEMVWKNLPLHLDEQGHYGRIGDRCYLGMDPKLPPAMVHNLRFILESTHSEHRRNQHLWVPQWNAATAITVVLRSPKPEDHWRYILDLLAEATWPMGAAQQLLQSTPWVPVRAGKFIAPDSFVCIAGLEADIEALSVKCDFAYAGVESLIEEVHSSIGYDRLLGLFPEGREALPTLALMMGSAGLTVGACGSLKAEFLVERIALLARVRSLPAWSIIERALVHVDRDAVVANLVRGVSTQLSQDEGEAALREIVELGSEKVLVDLFLCYLNEWRNCASSVGSLRASLPGLRLLAKNGHWALANSLAADVFGVEESKVLDECQTEILSGVIVRNIGMEPADLPSDLDGSTPNYDPKALEQTLRKLVVPLTDTSASGAVGALLGLMGPAARGLAETWLQPLAFEDYTNFLGWVDPGWESGPQRRRRYMGDMTVIQALDAVKPVVKIVSANKLVVLSLVGAPIELPILSDDQSETLLVGPVSFQANYGVVITIRPLDAIAARGTDEIKRLFQRTSEHLLRRVFNQERANLDALWASFAEVDQITLSIARQLILEGLQGSLQQLSKVKRHPTIAAALREVETSRRDRASAQQMRRKGNEAEVAYRAAIESLADVVANDSDVQRVILDGIRDRIADNQYELASIPFELFQNADDAVTELQQIQVADGRAPFESTAIGRFVVEQTDGVMRFFHWGRPINFTGRGNGARADFGSDLERMLMLGATAKSDDEQVTGKFGLGFKSVLLATNSPRVWSGDLAFKVVGGCLPERWVPSPATRDAQARLQGTIRSLRTTVVELALPEKSKRSEIGDRFSTLVGLLPVFARQIRKVVVDGEPHHWSPKVVIDGACVVSVGMCRLPVKGGLSTSNILVFETAFGSAVVRLAPQGVVAFERSDYHPIPAIWVTAPTSGIPAHGLVLNAPFQIDTGRANLASGRAASRNLAHVKKQAQAVSAGVVNLLEQSRSDWTTSCTALGCSALPNAVRFWATFWQAMDLTDLPEDPSKDTLLLHEFAFTLFDTVLRRTGELPNGLADSDAAFIKLDELRLIVDVGRMRAVMPEMLKWEAFQRAFPKTAWCSSEVAAWLKFTGNDEQLSLQMLDRATIFSLLRDAQIEPEDLRHIAGIVALWPTGPMEDYGWRAEFAKVKLRAADNTWNTASNLLRSGDPDTDLMVLFAPQSVQLHGEYAKSAAAWSALSPYLPSFAVDPLALTQWIAGARTVESQQASVQWILQNLYSPNAQLLLARRTVTWLFTLTRDSDVIAHLDNSQRTILLTWLGLLAEADEVPECSAEVFPELKAIHAWWMIEQNKRLEKYEKHLFPAFFDRAALTIEPYDRQSWMTIFSLGLMRRIGRVTDAQNKAFLEFLSARGWWAIICSASPETDAEGWMGILRDYGDMQDDSPLFEQWMDLFPRIYRVARWLDVYIHVFSTVDLRGPGQVRSLLAPSADASLSGSGINAPTMRGMLRLGQHLIIRELLRAGVLGGPIATALAYMPTDSLCSMLEGLGYERPNTSQDIHQLLVDELGEEAACFNGAYDIPLQLLATDAALRARVLAI
jgi:hypothetical protein